MPIGVRVEGLNSTLRALARAGADMDEMKQTMGEIAALGARLATSFAPTRTGRLAGTIRGNRAKRKAVIIAGRARVPYAGAINYGWPARKIKPAHFMQKVDTQIGPRAVEMLEAGLDSIIEKAGLQ